MAIQLNNSYVRASSGLLITVTDITGAYNATTNPGGYGGVNPGTGDFSDYNISVYMPDPVTLLPQSTPVVIPAYSTLPSSSSGTFDLTSLLLTGSSTTVLIDGWYQFIVSAAWDTGVASGTATLTSNLLMYQLAECCIDNLLVKAIGCGCSGSSKKITNIVKAKTILGTMVPRYVGGEEIESMIDECDQYNKAVTSLLELQAICSSSNCGGCNGC